MFTTALTVRVPVVVLIGQAAEKTLEPAANALALRLVPAGTPFIAFEIEELKDVYHGEYLLCVPGVEHAWPHPKWMCQGLTRRETRPRGRRRSVY